MDQVRLGATGLHVSRVCLGMMSYGNDSDRPWVLDEAAAEPIVRMAVEGGVTFFDTADVYSGGTSEVATGRLLRKFISRDEVVVATKVHGQTTPGPNGRGLSRKHILSAIDASLQRLGLDYVDLYQIHRYDLHTPIEETMDALNDVVRAGIRGILERHPGMEVVGEAPNGRATVDIACSLRPHVVVMDIAMPELNGLEATRQIVAADVGVKVIILSMHSSRQFVSEALKAVAAEDFDLAILDVNLKGESVWPVAAELRVREIPFILASGGHVDPPPAEFAGVPMIDKPYTIDRVTPALEAALAD